MMTEAEAKTKWCPQVRFILWEDKVISTRAGFSEAGNCLASGCTAWRWCVDSSADDTDDYGYCGLAGKP